MFDTRLHKLASSFLTVALCAAFAVGCGSRAKPAESEVIRPSSGEPQQYSATVVRTIETGERREVVQGRVARSGELFREEWTEGGQQRIVIWRPDQGKIFLLFPQTREYAETGMPEAAQGSLPAIDPEEVELAFGESDAPASHEIRALPDETIEGHPCRVFEQRAGFGDGRLEITRTFYAIDLAGLALRIESETLNAAARSRIVTERRDVRLEVSSEEFIVPADFRQRGRL